MSLPGLGLKILGVKYVQGIRGYQFRGMSTDKFVISVNFSGEVGIILKRRIE
jgi:hypothetical protein